MTKQSDPGANLGTVGKAHEEQVTDSVTVGQRVRQLRQKRRMSQADLARAASVTKTHVWQIESGTRSHMQFSTLMRYAQALGVSMHELQYGEAEGDPQNVFPPLDVCLRRTTLLTEDQIEEFIVMIHAVEGLRTGRGEEPGADVNALEGAELQDAAQP